MSEPYHTALKSGTEEDAPPLNEFTVGDSIAFVYDVFDPVPAIYDQVDAFYTEPPWPHGTKVFDERVGVTGRTWADLANRIDFLIESTTAPVVIPLGKIALKRLPAPTVTYDVYMPHAGAPAIIACWRTTLDQPKTTIDAARQLISRHTVIGDWFCGYGKTAVLAHEMNRRFVVSDYNPRCIGFLSQRFS
jgi:hypothetical protein